MDSEPARPDAERLLGLIDQMQGQAVALVADLVADRFLTGSPKRISREAPVLILSFESETFTPGGGANAVANVASLGGRPLPLGVVGDDASGHAVLEALEYLGVDLTGVALRPAFRTPTKTRILAGGRHSVRQQIVRIDVEEAIELVASERETYRRAIGAWDPPPSVAVLSDYGYGAVEPSLVPDLRQALGEEALLIGDSRHRLDSFSGLDGATPNEEEAEALAATPLAGEGLGIAESARELRQRLDLRFLLITRGRHGMALATPQGLAAMPVHGTDEVADVTGAGDTVIATFSLALAAGASPLEAALLADYAGGIVVMKAGTATVAADELRAAVRADPRPREELLWAGW